MKRCIQEIAFKAGFYLKPAAHPRLRRQYYKRFKGSSPFAFMCSYPRSGNTWTRLILAGLIDPASKFEDLDTIDELVPNNNQSLLSSVKPLIVKEHSPDFNMFNRVIYNVRDPRDVMVSTFNYVQSVFDYNYDWDRFIYDRIAHPFGFWHEHVRKALDWADLLPNKFHLIRYEDLHDKPQYEIERLAKFIGITTEPKKVSEIIKRTSFNEVKKVNRNNADPRKQSTIHTGKVGKWKEIFTDKQLFDLENLFMREMDTLGYKRVTA